MIFLETQYKIKNKKLKISTYNGKNSFVSEKDDININ